MRYIIFTVVFLFLVTPTTATYIAPEPPKPKTTFQLIDEAALEYRVSSVVMHKVIKCESQYSKNAIGDGGKSFGLVQIHLPSHPSVSKAQALDSEYAINFLAEKLSKGQGHLWTCFRRWYN